VRIICLFIQILKQKNIDSFIDYVHEHLSAMSAGMSMSASLYRQQLDRYKCRMHFNCDQPRKTMFDKLPTIKRSSSALEHAKTKGQVIGWIQGSAVTFIGLFLFKLIGWIPALLILMLLGFLGYKFVKKRNSSD